MRGFGFVRYLCMAFWQSWSRSKRDVVAYAEIYQRDWEIGQLRVQGRRRLAA